MSSSGRQIGDLRKGEERIKMSTTQLKLSNPNSVFNINSGRFYIFCAPSFSLMFYLVLSFCVEAVSCDSYSMLSPTRG